MKAKCPKCGAALTIAPTSDKFNSPECGKRLRIRPSSQPEIQPEGPKHTSKQEVTPEAREKPPWSARAWWALAVAIVAGFAPPGRILFDIAAIVLALMARHEIFGEHSLSLTGRYARKRGVWAANIALAIAFLDLVLITISLA